MRDTRIYSILVLVLSIFFCLCLAFLIWNFNNRPVTADHKTVPAPPNNITAAITGGDTRDSLQKIYAATVNYLNTKMETATDSASLGDMTGKTNDFDRLKNEIAALLKERGSEGDLELARLKIAELQLKVAQLYSRNKDIEEENRRLSALLAQQLAQSPKNMDAPAKPETATRAVNAARPTAGSAAFAATELRLQAVYSADEGEQETSVADDAEKLNGSFVVRGIQPGNAVVQVVVTQPNGQVLKGSGWESGAFETAEGRKIYSYQLKFDYAKGETKPLRFSLGNDRFMQGNYTVQLYCNGQVIGRVTKALL